MSLGKSSVDQRIGLHGKGHRVLLV
jgi:hypothetical protein